VSISMDWVPTLLAAAGTGWDPADPTGGTDFRPMFSAECGTVGAQAVLALQGELATGAA
jgi:hypothetical protein